MLRLFFPLYLLLFVFILFQSEIVDFTLRSLAPESEEADVLGDLSGATFMVEKILSDNPRSDWPDLLRQMSSENIQIRATDLNNPAIIPAAKQLLLAGDIWVAQIGEDLIYKKFLHSEDVMVIGPIYTVDEYQDTELMITLGSAMILVVLTLLWAFALQRRIRRLSDVAEAFGEDDFSVRASTDSKAQVGGLNRSFNHMADRIEQLISSHKELTNSVSHELRTPLSRIQFELEFAAELNSVDGLHQSLDSIAEDSRELDALISELLTYARYERNNIELQLQQQNISAWLADWLAAYRLPANSNVDLRIVTPGPEMLAFDAQALSRALSNLVANALRYAHQTIRLRLDTAGGQLIIAVEDDGTGIPEAQRQNLLMPFTRTDQHRNKQQGGFGLGLAIVHQIMQRHQGSVVITDSDLGGASIELHWQR
ncbi:ATP-binding protein [Bacterioplanoides sp.]|uniref:ATP-binding protein n=1 Tax=Bacterioplanoides sp. TaxID=2066072 RepID=UPI003B5CA800